MSNQFSYANGSKDHFSSFHGNEHSIHPQSSSLPQSFNLTSIQDPHLTNQSHMSQNFSNPTPMYSQENYLRSNAPQQFTGSMNHDQRQQESLKNAFIPSENVRVFPVPYEERQQQNQLQMPQKLLLSQQETHVQQYLQQQQPEWHHASQNVVQQQQQQPIWQNQESQYRNQQQQPQQLEQPPQQSPQQQPQPVLQFPRQQYIQQPQQLQQFPRQHNPLQQQPQQLQQFPRQQGPQQQYQQQQQFQQNLHVYPQQQQSQQQQHQQDMRYQNQSENLRLSLANQPQSLYQSSQSVANQNNQNSWERFDDRTGGNEKGGNSNDIMRQQNRVNQNFIMSSSVQGSQQRNSNAQNIAYDNNQKALMFNRSNSDQRSDYSRGNLNPSLPLYSSSSQANSFNIPMPGQERKSTTANLDSGAVLQRSLSLQEQFIPRPNNTYYQTQLRPTQGNLQTMSEKKLNPEIQLGSQNSANTNRRPTQPQSQHPYPVQSQNQKQNQPRFEGSPEFKTHPPFQNQHLFQIQSNSANEPPIRNQPQFQNQSHFQNEPQFPNQRTLNSTQSLGSEMANPFYPGSDQRANQRSFPGNIPESPQPLRSQPNFDAMPKMPNLASNENQRNPIKFSNAANNGSYGVGGNDQVMYQNKGAGFEANRMVPEMVQQNVSPLQSGPFVPSSRLADREELANQMNKLAIQRQTSQIMGTNQMQGRFDEPMFPATYANPSPGPYNAMQRSNSVESPYQLTQSGNRGNYPPRSDVRRSSFTYQPPSNAIYSQVQGVDMQTGQIAPSYNPNSFNNPMGGSSGHPIVIMPGYTSSDVTPHGQQVNLESRMESILQQIGNKEGLMFERLKKILTDLFSIQDEVLTFKGRRGDQKYIFIEEMLTRQLLALDSVQGSDELRSARRLLVRQVQGLISSLEMKAKV